MADISKCSGDGCEIRNKCYRYTAPKNKDYQSYIESYYQDGECGFFYEKPENSSWYNVKEE